MTALTAWLITVAGVLTACVLTLALAWLVERNDPQ
jgi:high-affinity Fe2+/Pb2+ permease